MFNRCYSQVTFVPVDVLFSDMWFVG